MCLPAPGRLCPPLLPCKQLIRFTHPAHTFGAFHTSHTLGGSGATVSALLAPDTDTAVRDTVTCDKALDLSQAMTHEERREKTLRSAPMRCANEAVL